LERVGLAGVEQRVPFHLSGGEKRRAGPAGGLGLRAGGLLLGEAAVRLPPRGRRGLICPVNDPPGTKNIAAPDLERVTHTWQRALVLDHGRLIADGPARTLLADAALMDAHGLEVPYSLTGIRD